jgi:pimeloyl-ACP methyl ester carboxylesterase
MEKVISKDGTPIAYDRTGRGAPVILVGGALSSRAAGVPLAALLAPHFSVFAYDRRGRGDSGDRLPYAVEREIEDLQALIQAAGGAASVFGMSSGAVLALEAAAHGLAIRKLALYEPPFIVDDTRPPVPPDYQAQIAGLVSSGRRGEAVEYFMTRAVGAPAEVVAQMRNASMWPGLEAVAHTLIYDNTILGDGMAGSPLPVRKYASVAVPVLVMDGGASPTWARNSVQLLADTIPGAQRRTLEGQTHAVDPQVLAPVLDEFFSD